MSIVFTRLVLGYVLALPFILPWLGGSISGEQGYTFVMRMSSTAGGLLQLFYDIGSGYNAQTVASTALVISDTAFEYRMPVPPATYRSLRIDPGSGAGLYIIESAAITGADGSTVMTVPVTELQAVQHVTILERSPTRLVVSVPSDGFDPMLVWTPPSPFALWLEPTTTARVFRDVALLWLAATAAIWGLAWALGRVWPSRTGVAAWTSAFGAANPAVAVVIAAFLATLVATYPVVFAGRSYVAPANGGTGLLYDQPPFTAGADDLTVEDVRGTDVGAMMWQSLAHSLVQRQALADGEVPLWNRYTALGRPLWGLGLSYILDPLHWLTFLGSDPAPGWDLKFLSHRFVFAVGVGLASLAATGAWLPAAIVATCAPFAGVFSYSLNHPAIFSLTYAPWVLLGWFLLAKATTVSALARATILLAVTSALLLTAPTPKEGALATLAVSATGALAVLLSIGSWRLRRQRFAAAVVAGIAAVLLTTPHWLVFLDTLSQSAHAYQTPYVSIGNIFHRVGLWVSPLMPDGPLPALHLFALMLVAVAVSAPLRLWNDRSTVACLVVATLILAIALGLVPMSGLIGIPLISQIGHFHFAATFAALTPLLIVCASGARILCTAGTARTVVATIAAGVAAWWLLTRMGELGPFNRFEPWAVALLLPLVIAWPVCLLLARRPSGAAVVASVATMATLVLPGGMHLETGVPAIDRIIVQPRARARLTQSSPAIDALHAAETTPTRTTGVMYSLFPGSSVIFGLEDLRGADPLEVQAYRELSDAAGIQRTWYWLTMFDFPDVARLSPFLDMLNVGFLIARADILPPGAAVLPMNGPDLVRAVQRPAPWPRAFFTDATSTYPTLADFAVQVLARRGPFATILDGDAAAVGATSGLPRTRGTAIAADNYVLTANTTAFRVRTDREGIAVLGETYLSDDFIATLNGNDVPYFRVNHVFKAVRIPGPGEWTVRFEYRPRRWRLAVGMAGMGALMLIGLAAVAWRSRVATHRGFESVGADSLHHV